MDNKLIYEKETTVFLLIILGFFIYNKWLPIIGSALFILFILDFVYTLFKVKRIALLTTILAFIFFVFGILQFGMYIKNNFDDLLKIDLNQLSPILHYLKIPVPADFDFNFLLKVSLEYIKSHLDIVSEVGKNSLQIIIGLIFGVLFFSYEIKTIVPENNVWSHFIETITVKLKIFFESFKTIMQLQVIVSIMNTISLSILSLGIAKLITGEFLPYWYILLPLTAIFSLVPVIGNIIINLLIFFISINISLTFTIIAIIYFFLIHKLELVVIGKLLGNKVSVPFLFVAISMLLGELIFNSMLGILFGITFLLTIRTIMKNMSLQNLNKYDIIK